MNPETMRTGGYITGGKNYISIIIVLNQHVANVKTLPTPLI